MAGRTHQRHSKPVGRWPPVAQERPMYPLTAGCAPVRVPETLCAASLWRGGKEPSSQSRLGDRDLVPEPHELAWWWLPAPGAGRPSRLPHWLVLRLSTGSELREKQPSGFQGLRRWGRMQPWAPLGTLRGQQQDRKAHTEDGRGVETGWKARACTHMRTRTHSSLLGSWRKSSLSWP